MVKVTILMNRQILQTFKVKCMLLSIILTSKVLVATISLYREESVSSMLIRTLVILFVIYQKIKLIWIPSCLKTVKQIVKVIKLQICTCGAGIILVKLVFNLKNQIMKLWSKTKISRESSTLLNIMHHWKHLWKWRLSRSHVVKNIPQF